MKFAQLFLTIQSFLIAGGKFMAKQINATTKTTQRDTQILEILEQNGPTSVHELCKKLYLSEATVRRSLSELAHKELINRTHGGAELRKVLNRARPFSNRMFLNTAAKRDIARKAASIVPNDCTIFLDQSSTCYYLAEADSCRIFCNGFNP